MGIWPLVSQGEKYVLACEVIRHEQFDGYPIARGMECDDVVLPVPEGTRKYVHFLDTVQRRESRPLDREDRAFTQVLGL